MSYSSPVISRDPSAATQRDAKLAALLAEPPQLAIAISGGIDSLTLAAMAGRARGQAGLTLCHAVSPAVPAAATARVRAFAQDGGYTLQIFDAGEFADARYLANPVNRCYFCKTNLYARIVELAPDDLVASGTNLDDLGDFRPGLDAAREQGVFHPFVEAGLAKADVRALARCLGLGDLAELPAAPCLASRVETGLRIDPAELALIDAVEVRLRKELGEVTLRCRRRIGGFTLELDAEVLAEMDETRRRVLIGVAEQVMGNHGIGEGITLEPYRRGSAFRHG